MIGAAKKKHGTIRVIATGTAVPEGFGVLWKGKVRGKDAKAAIHAAKKLTIKAKPKIRARLLKGKNLRVFAIVRKLKGGLYGIAFAIPRKAPARPAEGQEQEQDPGQAFPGLDNAADSGIEPDEAPPVDAPGEPMTPEDEAMLRVLDSDEGGAVHVDEVGASGPRAHGFKRIKPSPGFKAAWGRALPERVVLRIDQYPGRNGAVHGRRILADNTVTDAVVGSTPDDVARKLLEVAARYAPIGGDDFGAANDAVLNAWVLGKYAQSGSLRSDGRDLYSYNLRIGTRNSQGQPVVFDYTGAHKQSQTTSKHVSAAIRAMRAAKAGGLVVVPGTAIGEYAGVDDFGDAAYPLPTKVGRAVGYGVDGSVLGQKGDYVVVVVRVSDGWRVRLLRSTGDPQTYTNAADLQAWLRSASAVLLVKGSLSKMTKDALGGKGCTEPGGGIIGARNYVYRGFSAIRHDPSGTPGIYISAHAGNARTFAEAVALLNGPEAGWVQSRKSAMTQSVTFTNPAVNGHVVGYL